MWKSQRAGRCGERSARAGQRSGLGRIIYLSPRRPKAQVLADLRQEFSVSRGHRKRGREKAFQRLLLKHRYTVPNLPKLTAVAYKDAEKLLTAKNMHTRWRHVLRIFHKPSSFDDVEYEPVYGRQVPPP